MSQVGTASIKFEADVGQVSDTLVAKMDEALAKIDGILAKVGANAATAASSAGDAVGQNIEDGAKRADSALAGIDGDGMAGATQAAQAASGSISDVMQDAAGRAESALSGVDGNGFNSATSSASSAASSVAGRFVEEAGRADAALAGVDGDGFTSATSSGSRSASSIRDAMQQAADDVSSSWRETGEDIEESFSGAEGAASSFGGIARTAAGGAAAVLGLAGAGQIVSDAFAKNTSIEDTTAVIEVLTGSADTAKATMDDLVESNWDTPIKFDLWAEAGKTLIAFGMDTKDVSGTVTALGEAAAASGEGEEGLQRLSRAFGQALATGTMQGDTLNQLAESGVPALDILGNHYGKTAEEMRKMASEGLPAEEAIQVLTEGIMEGTDGVAGSTAAFEGTMGKLAQTTSGVLGNLGSAFVNVASTAITPFLGALSGVASWLTDAAYSLQDFITWLQEGSVAADALKIVLAGFAGLAVVSILARLTAGVSLVAKVVAGATKVWRFFNLAFLATPAGMIITAIVAVVGVFTLLWKHVDGFREFWQNLWSSIQDAMAPVVDWITEKFELVKGAWSDLVSAFTSDDAVEGDGALGKLIGVDRANAILGTIQTAKGAWSDIVGVVRGGDAPAGGGALAHLIGAEAAEGVLDGISRVRDAFTGLRDLIFKGDYTGSLWDAFGVAEDSAFVGAILTVRDTLMELPDLASGVADILFRGDFTGLPFGLEEDSAIVNILFGIRDAVQDTWTAFQNLGGTLLDVGKVLGGAVWSTIQSVFSALGSVIGSVVRVGQSLFGAFLSIAGAVWDLLQALAPILLPILKVIGAVVGGILVGAFFALMGALRLVAGLIGVVANVIAWLAENVLTPLISVIATVVSWLAEKLGGALSWVAELIGTVFENIGPALASAWQWVQDTWSAGVAWLAEAWAGLQQIWADYGQPVVDFIVDAFRRIWDFISLVGRLIGAAFEVLWIGLGKAWSAWGQPVIDFVVDAFQWLWSGLQTVFGWVRTGWDLLWSGLQLAWSTFGQPIVDLVLWAFDMAWLGLSTIFGWITDGWNRLWSGAQNLWASYGQPVIDRVSYAFAWVQFQIDRALFYIRAYIDLAGFKIRALWAEYVQPMIDWVTDGFTDLMDTIRGWKDNVIGWFSDAGSWLFDAGKNIVEGLINGAQSLLSNIGQFFLDVVPDWIQDPFKRALGIASPSRVFADYGRNIGEGLIQGVSGMTSDVQAATSGLAQAAADIPLPAPTPGVAPVDTPGDAAAAATSTVDLGPMLDGQGQALTGFSATADAALAGVAGPAWDQMALGMQATKTAVLDPTLAGLNMNLQATAGQFPAQVWGTVVPSWQQMGANIQGVRAGVVDPALWGIQSNLGATASQFASQITGTINPQMTGMGSHIMGVKVGTIDPAFAGIQSGLSNVVGAFANGARDVGTHMENMRRSTADPVRFTMNTIFSDGLVEMWNSVSDMIGTKTMGKKYASFRTGGIMPGYTPGRDVHRFVSPTGGVLDLSGGEPVLRPEVGKVLGSDWVHGVNSAARAEGTHGVARFLEHQHHANGGFLQFARGGYIPQAPALGGTVSPIGRSHEAFIERFFPGIFTLTSANRPGDSGHHGAGRATDWQDSGAQWPTPASKALSRAIAATFPSSLELIHWPTDGWTNIKNGRPANYDSGTNAGHANHVHWATAGLVTADGITGALTAGDPINWDIDWDGMLRGMVQEHLDDINASVAAASYPGAAGGVPQGTWDNMREPALDSMASTMEEYFKAMGDGGGAERWRPLAMQALARHGYNPAEHIEAMLQQIDIESSGIPNNWNLWDSNYLRGTPSGGLLQVIKPTYDRVRRAYPEAFEGLPDDMMFPLTNLTAGVGAVRMDWGGPAGRWPTRDGYEDGGLMGYGEGLFHKTAFEPERVLSPAQTRSFDQLVDWTTRTPEPVIRDRVGGGTGGAYGNGTTREVHVTQNIHTTDPQQAGDRAADQLTSLIV